jgi:hypothetical protein
MTARGRFWTVFTLALIFEIGQGASLVTSQTQSEGRPWEINAGDLQAVGLHLPSYMISMEDLWRYQALLPTHQELSIAWDPHTGYDGPVFRERVAERSLKHDFTVLQRKQNIKGNASVGDLALMDMSLEVVAITGAGEVRGLVSGPSLLVRGESLSVPGGPPTPQPHDYIMGGKDMFSVSIPDDPKIEKLVLLLAHPNEKPRLEQVGVIDLTAKVAPK